MQVIQRAADFDTRGRKVCLAIGVFDGVHIGHQRIIGQTLQDAASHHAVSAVVTFDRHPSHVVAPARVPPLVYRPARRAREIQKLGVEVLLVIPFTESFSRLCGEGFVRSLVSDFGRVQSISVGRRFTFGHARRGNVTLLEKLGAELNFQVNGIESVAYAGEPVSSTRIRETLQQGSFDGAAAMLGRPWTLEGEVLRGDGIGRQLGVPTANLEVAGMVLPPTGVYLAEAIVEPSLRRRAVVNIGLRPTLNRPQPELRVEAHLLGFQGDLYGASLGLRFDRRLRDERKFDSLEELKARIREDIRQAESAE